MCWSDYVLRGPGESEDIVARQSNTNWAPALTSPPHHHHHQHCSSSRWETETDGQQRLLLYIKQTYSFIARISISGFMMRWYTNISHIYRWKRKERVGLSRCQIWSCLLTLTPTLTVLWAALSALSTLRFFSHNKIRPWGQREIARSRVGSLFEFLKSLSHLFALSEVYIFQKMHSVEGGGLREGGIQPSLASKKLNLKLKRLTFRD